MKAVFVLAVATAMATAQYYGRRPFGGRPGGFFVAPAGGIGPIHGGGGGGGFKPLHAGGIVVSHGGHSVGGFGGGLVDKSYGGSDYHFSWRHDGGQNYEWGPANHYCAKLGPGWYGVSIESYDEDEFIDSIIGGDKVKYIWTGGSFDGYGWKWASGAPFKGLDWSYTGGAGIPQPDNREDGKEFCLAVLNYFYQDGITWHDVACHHPKPIICERRSHTYG
ncbi:lectin-like [Macrobrachium rosenbergii]|uniref:lectin-like n=1 Tax=Macrobrachium rosenbergii TaxID=79674 RepID=UPI0034D69149